MKTNVGVFINALIFRILADLHAININLNHNVQMKLNAYIAQCNQNVF